MNYKNRLKSVMSVLPVTLTLWATTAANADIITINDLTDTLTVSSDGSSNKITILQNSNEFLRFDYASARVNKADTGSYVVVINEPGSLTISDLFEITATNGSNILNVSFYSDPALFPNMIPDLTITEDGTAQQLVQYWGGSADPGDTFKVASDAIERGEVPEPSSIVLLVTVVLAFCVGAWRRRKYEHHEYLRI